MRGQGGRTCVRVYANVCSCWVRCEGNTCSCGMSMMDMAYEHTFGTQCPRCLQAHTSMLEGMQAHTSTGEDPANVCSMGARGVPPFGVPSMGSGMHDLGYAHPGPRTSGRGGAARHNAEGSFMAENPCKRRSSYILPRNAPSGLRGVPDRSLRTGPNSRGSLVVVVLVRAHARARDPPALDHPRGTRVAPARSGGWCHRGAVDGALSFSGFSGASALARPCGQWCGR